MLPYLQRSADSSDGRGSHHASASRLDRVLLSPGPEGGDEEGMSEEERGLAIDPDFPWQTTYKEYVSQTTRRSRGGEGARWCRWWVTCSLACLPACCDGMGWVCVLIRCTTTWASCWSWARCRPSPP